MQSDTDSRGLEVINERIEIETDFELFVLGESDRQ